MAIINCPVCGKPCSSLAAACPYCGISFHQLNQELHQATQLRQAPETDLVNSSFGSRALTIMLVSFLIGCGCCGYKYSNSPHATDWNLQGEDKEWGSIKPWEKDKIASDLWSAAGCSLILFAPVIGGLLSGLAEKLSESRKNNQK